MAAHRRTGLSGVLVAATLAAVIVLLLLPGELSTTQRGSSKSLLAKVLTRLGVKLLKSQTVNILHRRRQRYSRSVLRSKNTKKNNNPEVKVEVLI